jgi:plasmid stabilization system protein ParE
MAEHKPPIIWSPEALNDINHIWDYYAGTAGRATADKVLRQIAKVVATIDDFPLAGRTRDEIRTGLRSLATSPQVIFYRLKGFDSLRPLKETCGTCRLPVWCPIA